MKELIVERAVPTNKKLYSGIKSRIKKRFKVWPSAYASAALVKAYKKAGGGYRTVKETIQNPNNLIEGMASEGWIRGGVPSRELTRDRDFYTAHTAGQYA